MKIAVTLKKIKKMMMTKTTKEMIEVMQAYERGEQIQFLEYGGVKWEDCVGEPYWNWGKYDYRVKPIPMCWRAMKGKPYYIVGTDGDVWMALEAYTKIDKNRFNIGNYFKSKEDAKRAAMAFKESLIKLHEEISNDEN